MIISKIKNKLKKIIEIIESIFYYNAKFNSTYPLFTIISIVIFIIIFSAPVIQQLFLRINYLPEEQVQFLDTIYQPLNKINLENIEDNIKYNELLSITRSKIKNTNLNYKNGEPYSYLFEKDELNKIKNKTLQNLDKDKLGKYISIIEYVTVDTEHIDTEYVLGRGQGVINKNTIYQTWKIQNLLETMNVEIPEQYFQSQPNNKKLNIGAAADKTIENKNIHSNLNSSQENVKVTPLNNDNKNNLNLDNKNIPHKTFNLNDICVKNENKKCIIHSPLMIWKYNITKLEIDNNIIDTITSYIQNNVNETVSFHSMFSGISFSSTGKMKSSNALIITFFIESKLISGTTLTSSKAWTLLYKKVLNNIMDKKYQDIKISQYRISKISKELAYKTDKIDIIPSEYIVLFAIYVSLFIYISFSIGRIEFVKSKYILGFVAVISVSLSLIISLGFLEFLFGVNSSMFYPWSVFPYLIMTIGVENITVIVKSVVNTSIELPFTERYALGMKNISWEIIIPLIINVINISCGTFSSYSYISEFCFYTSLCIVFNFWLQTCLFGTVLSIDIKSLELYDLYKMQFEKNHKLIDRIGKNNIRYSSDNENKPYHPILDIKSEDFSDTESLDNTKNNNKRKVRWNWTVVFIVFSLLIFGSNINQDEENKDVFYYSENYNKTYNSLSMKNKDSIDLNSDVITSISHILPKYWNILQNRYNEKINVVSSDFTSMNINYFIVMNNLLHISVEDKFEKLYDPSVNIFGINILKYHSFVIILIMSFGLLMVILFYMFLNSCFYILYSKISEYSKRITSTFVNLLYYFVPIFDYDKFIFKKYINPLYQPNFITKVKKEQLEHYQKYINYNGAYSSSIDIHIINIDEYETIDYIIIKNPNQKYISNRYQQNFDGKDEKAIILWGGKDGSIYLWSDEPLIKKRNYQNRKENPVGVYYYRNLYLAKAKYYKKNDNNIYIFENFSVYINKPTFKCEKNNNYHINDLSLDVFNDNVLMASKTFLYQWEYINKKINYFDIIKAGEDDEILWILNSNEYYDNIQNYKISQYLQNQQFFDNDLGAQINNNEEPFIKIVITKRGKIIIFDAFMNIISSKESEETEHLLNQYQCYTSTIHDKLSTSVYTSAHDESFQRNNLSSVNSSTTSPTSSMTSPFNEYNFPSYNLPINNIPVCYHYDALNRLWISFKNKMIICYELPLLQPLFVLNENIMHFTVLSPQAKAEININKNNSFYTNNNNNYWSSQYKGHKRNSSDYGNSINEKLFISRKYSKLMTSNEEVGWLVTSDATGYMTVWNIKEGRVWDNVKCPSSITKIFIVKSQSKQGTWWIVSSHEDETVRFWSTNAGILSCSSVLYQPGCNTIACHNNVIAGVRRVRIQDNTFIEKTMVKLFIYLVLVLNLIVNIFLRYYHSESYSSVDIIYEYLIQIYYDKGRTILRRTFIRILDFIFRFLPLPENLTSSTNTHCQFKNFRNLHRHCHHHTFMDSTSTSTSSFSNSTKDDNLWMWQVWLYNVDTDLPRYLNFAVDKLNGLGVPPQRVVAMPRLNILFQIYDLTITEENNSFSSTSSSFNPTHPHDEMRNSQSIISKGEHSFKKKQNELNIHEIGKLYNEIPSDVNIEDIGNSLGITPNEEFHIHFPEHKIPNNVNRKEHILRKSYNQPPVLKINHININSRLICFDFGQHLRVFSFKNIERKKKNMH